jgi:hypothetical protein
MTGKRGKRDIEGIMEENHVGIEKILVCVNKEGVADRDLGSGIRRRRRRRRRKRPHLVGMGGF